MRKMTILTLLLALPLVGFSLCANEPNDELASVAELPAEPIRPTSDLAGEDLCRKECEPVCCPPSTCCRCLDFFFNVDLLYWRAWQDGLEGCGITTFEEFSTEDGGNVAIFSNKDRHMHFDWNPGFRLGIGQRLVPCHLDMSLIWTTFRTKAHSHQRDDGSSNLFSFSGASSSSNPRAFVHRHWTLDYNTCDLVLGRSFCFDTYCFGLCPFLGVRGAWIQQRLHSKAVTKFGSEIDSEINYIVSSKDRQNLWGVGPYVGLEANWGIGCHFSLFASLDVGLLYGRSNIRSKTLNTLVNDANFCNNRRNKDVCDVFGDAAIGIRWCYCFCDCLLLNMELSWEHHRYFDHNRFRDHGDLCFDGGVYSVGFEF